MDTCRKYMLNINHNSPINGPLLPEKNACEKKPRVSNVLLPSRNLQGMTSRACPPIHQSNSQVLRQDIPQHFCNGRPEREMRERPTILVGSFIRRG